MFGIIMMTAPNNKTDDDDDGTVEEKKNVTDVERCSSRAADNDDRQQQQNRTGENSNAGGSLSKKTSSSKESEEALAASPSAPSPGRPMNVEVQPPKEKDEEKVKPFDGGAIEDLNENDVLCGRGAATNQRSGNRRYRALVKHFQPTYINTLLKEDKTRMSHAIVEAIRNARPPGRFLKRDEVKGHWYEIGDKKAREKTSQTLREGIPLIRRSFSRMKEAMAAQQQMASMYAAIQEQQRLRYMQQAKYEQQQKQQQQNCIENNEEMSQQAPSTGSAKATPGHGSHEHPTYFTQQHNTNQQNYWTPVPGHPLFTMAGVPPPVSVMMGLGPLHQRRQVPHPFWPPQSHNSAFPALTMTINNDGNHKNTRPAGFVPVIPPANNHAQQHEVIFAPPHNNGAGGADEDSHQIEESIATVASMTYGRYSHIAEKTSGPISSEEALTQLAERDNTANENESIGQKLSPSDSRSIQAVVENGRIAEMSETLSIGGGSSAGAHPTIQKVKGKGSLKQTIAVRSGHGNEQAESDGKDISKTKRSSPRKRVMSARKIDDQEGKRPRIEDRVLDEEEPATMSSAFASKTADTPTKVSHRISWSCESDSLLEAIDKKKHCCIARRRSARKKNTDIKNDDSRKICCHEENNRYRVAPSNRVCQCSNIKQSSCPNGRKNKDAMLSTVAKGKNLPASRGSARYHDRETPDTVCSNEGDAVFSPCRDEEHDIPEKRVRPYQTRQKGSPFKPGYDESLIIDPTDGTFPIHTLLSTGNKTVTGAYVEEAKEVMRNFDAEEKGRSRFNNAQDIVDLDNALTSHHLLPTNSANGVSIVGESHCSGNRTTYVAMEHHSEIEYLVRVLSRKKNDLEGLHGVSFLSQEQALYRELRSWEYPPAEPTVEELRALLLGYVFIHPSYPSSSRPPSEIAAMISSLSRKSRVAEWRIIPLVASRLLSEQDEASLGSFSENEVDNYI